MESLFITGGNNGIGYYMVKEWLEIGNTASVLDLSVNHLEMLQKEHQDRLVLYKGDVCSKTDVQKAVSQTKDAFGNIDYAVHNACSCMYKSFSQHTEADYNHVMSVNFQGAVNLTEAILPIMASQKFGKICFTSSGIGTTGYINISSYSASKGAIEAFAKCMNLEYKDSGVTFHLLHPPLTDTESCSPIPVPKEFKASPEKVGKGLIKHIHKDKFIITPSLGDTLSVKLSYRFPLAMGRLLAKMTAKANQ